MRVTADVADAGERLDRWLSRQVPEVSRTRIRDLIREGHITSPGRALAPDTRVAPGLAVDVDLAPKPGLSAAPEDIPLHVLFEDPDLLVIDKPPGLVVHPAPGHGSGTLVNALLHHCATLAGVGEPLRPGIVHRLDRDTSGVLVVAGSERALNDLARQFREREVTKRYAALVHGVPRPPRGRIETEIGRSRHDRKKMSTHVAHGREAVTEYEVAEVLGAVSVLRVRIATGRTHQIRVHMAHIGCPVLGDAQYGRPGLDRQLPVAVPRQMLHAETLTLRHPGTGREMTFTAPWPADMTAVAAALRRQ